MANEVTVRINGQDMSVNAFLTAQERVRTFRTTTLRAIEEMNARRLRIDADTVRAQQRIDRLRQEAETATGPRRLQIDADIAAAEARIRTLQRRSDDLRRDIRLRVDADTQPAESALRRMLNGLQGSEFRGHATTALKAGLLGAAAVAVGPLGNAVAGGIVAGAGAGMIGAAALLQKDNPQVKAAGEKLGRTFKEGFKDASSGMAGPLTGALDIFQRQLAADLPTIRVGFDAVAGAVEPLAQGLAGMVHNILPGFISAVQSSKPVLEAIAARLPELGESIGSLFMTAAAAAPYAVDALTQLITVVEWTINGVRGGIVAFQVWSEAMHGHVMSVDEIKAAYAGLVPDLSQVTEGTLTFGDSAEDAKSKLEVLTSALLAHRDADRAFYEAVDQATETLKKNGKTLDITTKRGRENQAALDRVAVATQRASSAAKANGLSMEYQNAVMKLGADRLVAMGIRMGMTRKQAEAYAAKLLGIPSVVNTRASLDTSAARASLNAWQGALNRVMGSVTAQAGPWKGGYTFPGRGTGGISHAAEGGPRGNLTMVGEYGRELVRLPFGSSVSSNPDTERILSGGGGGSREPIRLEVTGEAALVDMFRRMVRVRGGDVQLVFGS